ncbi:DUF6063 family protein [Evansella cellulosilytica]|uniref:Non-ribosomal peptide synthetase module n=1 Tax=Evansella cellulosilytica (strain ATCC 21833 / DSM 2522 / FERM P-1141 / JCM 9156 / N-4) TaxID=649639 RepID=E6TQY1_EVAC2|nr:DUF6063 family protein [Evansella cellulosilytica]ADU29357.1 hypothetical protein Bcell_1087 [Evansella cellulosilytica DSM 2522]
MKYSEEKIVEAFKLYTVLARDGYADVVSLQKFKADDDIRSLLESFSREVESVIIRTSEQIYLVPKTKLSPFHVSNDWIKRNYLRSGATNGDIYLLYFSSLILFGAFYDSYQSQEPTRQFLRQDEWLRLIQARIEQLKSLDEETLKGYEKEFSYNWSLIIEKWDDMDDIKETAKKQTGKTISRFSFLDTVKRFLIDQGLVTEIGDGEVTLTEKAKTIIQRFFMEIEYNKGIFEFIYSFERAE